MKPDLLFGFTPSRVQTVAIVVLHAAEDIELARARAVMHELRDEAEAFARRVPTVDDWADWVKERSFLPLARAEISSETWAYSARRDLPGTHRLALDVFLLDGVQDAKVEFMGR